MLLPLIFCHIAFLVSSRNMDSTRKLKTQVDSHGKRTKSSADRTHPLHYLGNAEPSTVVVLLPRITIRGCQIWPEYAHGFNSTWSCYYDSLFYSYLSNSNQLFLIGVEPCSIWYGSWKKIVVLVYFENHSAWGRNNKQKNQAKFA